MKKYTFKQSIKKGIPIDIPTNHDYNELINHAPIRKYALSKDEKILAIKNALRYFPKNQHDFLMKDFLYELNTYGKIYMYRFKPEYEIKGRSINDFPYKSKKY